jgi:peptide deformylase
VLTSRNQSGQSGATGGVGVMGASLGHFLAFIIGQLWAFGNRCALAWGLGCMAWGRSKKRGQYAPMALLTILTYPDPRLHTVAKPVAVVDERIRQLIADMTETMYEAKGIGLAATQVDVHERVIVIDVSEEHNQPLALINPVIEWASSDRIKGEEGCLSVPGIYDGVERAHQVRVSALDASGQAFTVEAEGLESICLQHEIDHLDGRLFIDHLSRLKRDMVIKKFSKIAKQNQPKGRMIG